jgi:hypothetical protein
MRVAAEVGQHFQRAGNGRHGRRLLPGRGVAAGRQAGPRGHGQAGLGNITGYSWAEVLEIPALPAADLLAYLDQVTASLAGQLRAMSPEQLHTLVPGINGRRTPYRWLRPILQGCFRHLGEIEGLKSWQAGPE